MEDTAKQKIGRPSKNPEHHKRGRTLSFTDAEYTKLGELAAGANLDRSEYIIRELGLNKK